MIVASAIADLPAVLKPVCLDGLAKAEQRALSRYPVLTTEEIERLTYALMRDFEVRRMGLTDLQSKARDELIISVLRRSIVRFSAQSAMSADEYFSHKYRRFFYELKLPIRFLLRIDGVLMRSLTRRPVERAVVGPGKHARTSPRWQF